MAFSFSKAEVGLVLEVDADKDLTGASSLQIEFEDPTRVRSLKTATFATDGSDGKLNYAKLAADFQREGPWRMRGRYVLNGDNRLTTWYQFRVTE